MCISGTFVRLCGTAVVEMQCTCTTNSGVYYRLMAPLTVHLCASTFRLSTRMCPASTFTCTAESAIRREHLPIKCSLRGRLARQDATIAKQAATISEQAATLAHQTSAPSNMTLQTCVMLLGVGVCCARVAACRPCNCLHLS